ncbi:hypothetical protein GJ689_19295 [Rhodoplanes serenus]|uniref:Acyl-CoA transferase n=1 Tax=Rhodoplanes serenus TaxID=200615 RepID=A0A9X4XQF6_9BRAD|nr:hypothetical protein [Rhodoplanes serenus]MTW18351.1 hypothetical protein [Rhodoplanes serenus]
MTSKREAVLDAVRALIAGALPNAEVKRNLAKPERIPPGGLVVIRDGDPGEPEVTLSPVSYLYTHRIAVEIAAFESATLTREQVLDGMLGAIGAAIAADRRLGGLADWIEAEAPVSDDAETQGALPARTAEFAIVAVYATADPLT